MSVRVRQERVLPALLDVQPGEIRRVEIVPRAGADDRIVFDRRDGPLADGQARRRGGRSDADRGPDPQPHELAPSRPTPGRSRDRRRTSACAHPPELVRLFGAGNDRPGRSRVRQGRAQGRRYCRPSGAEGIEVVDARLFQELDASATDWRDKSVFNLSTFQVAGLTVTRPGRPRAADRTRGGHWKLMRPRIRAGRRREGRGGGRRAGLAPRRRGRPRVRCRRRQGLRPLRPRRHVRDEDRDRAQHQPDEAAIALRRQGRAPSSMTGTTSTRTSGRPGRRDLDRPQGPARPGHPAQRAPRARRSPTSTPAGSSRSGSSSPAGSSC